MLSRSLNAVVRSRRHSPILTRALSSAAIEMPPLFECDHHDPEEWTRLFTAEAEKIRSDVSHYESANILKSLTKADLLRGRLVHTRASGEKGKERCDTRVQFVLAPEDALQYVMWREERAQLEPLHPPTKINRGFFQCLLESIVSTETNLSTETMDFVRFSTPCPTPMGISSISVSAEKAVDVSGLPKFPCINAPSGGFDLRTSRDC